MGAIQVTADVSEATTLEQLVDQDLAQFEEFFATKLGNGAMTRPERAIIKTYLGYKLGVVGREAK